MTTVLQVGLPGFRNVSFTDVTALSENGILISSRDQQATDPDALTGIAFVRLNLTVARFGPWNATWAQHDYRPMDAGAATPGIIPALVDGVYVENAASVVFTDSSVAFQGEPQ